MSRLRLRIAKLLARTSEPVSDAFGFVVALVLRLIARRYRLEIQEVRVERIGHLALEPDLLLSSRKQAGIATAPVIFFSSPHQPANEFLVTLWKRSHTFGPRWLLRPAYKFARKRGWNELTPTDWPVRHTDTRCFDGSGPHLQLNGNELMQGVRLLDDMGVATNRPIVCLAVRDSAYLRTRFPDRDWSYHDYRDSPIDSYELMAHWLAEAGYSVIRMGRVVESPFTVANTHVHDYANSPYRSDFADVYLFSNCAFTISTSTGMDALGTVFRRPMGSVNIVDIGAIHTGSHVKMAMLKDLLDPKTGKFLHLDDPRAVEAYSSAGELGLERAGLQPVPCSPHDLLNFAQEFHMLMRGEWIATPEHLGREAQLRQALPPWRDHPPHVHFPRPWLQHRLPSNPKS